MLTIMISNKRVPEKTTHQMPCNFYHSPELLMFVKEMGFEVPLNIVQDQADGCPPVYSVVGTLKREIYLQLMWTGYGFPYPKRVSGFDDEFNKRFAATTHYLRCVCFVSRPDYTDFSPPHYMVHESKEDSLAEVLGTVMSFIRKTFFSYFPKG